MLRLCQTLRLDDFAADSIFKKAEELLDELKFQRALIAIGNKKTMARYRSRMDFFFCELFPAWRWDCWRFYHKDGPPLRETLTDFEIAYLDAALVIALHIALAIKEQGIEAKWGEFREMYALDVLKIRSRKPPATGANDVKENRLIAAYQF